MTSLKCLGRFVFGTALAAVLVGVPVAWAQEGDASADDSATTEESKRKLPAFGLYLFASWGEFSSDDVDLSNQTTVERTTGTTFELDDIRSGQAVIGWKLPDGKGDFRLKFTGYAEESFRIESTGFAQQLEMPAGNLFEVLPWGQVLLTPGSFKTSQRPPTWRPCTGGLMPPDCDDANGDGLVQASETIPSDNAVFDLDLPFNDDLENRLQTYDLVYGRTWGKPRFTGRWFAGARYFIYEGNVPVTAWLFEQDARFGFTDGAFIPLLNFRQETSGWGPTGSIEAQVNFWDRKIQIYFQGGASFLLADLKSDSGNFASFVEDTAGGVLVSLPGRLVEERERSVWHTHGEAGVRLLLDMGIEVELAYAIDGYLDSLLLPPQILIPETVQQAAQEPSALFSTQDLIFDGWRFGVGYQF